MKIKKEKIVFLLMGLVLGFTLGVSILFWQQSINLSQKLFIKTKQFVIGLFDSKEHEAVSEEVIVNKRPPKKKNKTITVDSLSLTNDFDSSGNDYNEYGDISPDDTLWYDEYSDVYRVLNSKEDEEPVARDRMILKKQIEAKLLTKSTSPVETSNLDSLLIGGKFPKETNTVFNVEFWESPLNYKGYKKIKNLLVLYGIKQIEQTQLKILKNDLYLATSETFYLMENTSDFRNLIPITNQQLINQLKEK